MTSTTLRGSCLCGAVRYEAAGEPLRFLHCHCSRCRKATGTGHASNLFLQPGALRWLSGEENIHSFKVPDAQRFTNSFCQACGSRLPRQATGSDLVLTRRTTGRTRDEANQGDADLSTDEESAGRAGRQRRDHAGPALRVGCQPQHPPALSGAGRRVPARRREPTLIEEAAPAVARRQDPQRRRESTSDAPPAPCQEPPC